MKAIIALLLGLISYVNASSFEFDSNDNADGDTTSYDGFVFTVSNYDGEAPEVRFSTDLDDHDTTICFDLTRLFESEDYPDAVNEDPTYTVLSGTEVKFAEAGCVIDETTMTSTSFEITCDSVGGGSLTATFNFIANNPDTGGNDGLKYTIVLNDYEMASNRTKLIIEQSLRDCSDEYDYSADGGDTDDDGDDEDDDGSSTTEQPDAETDRRRRNLLDTDDEDVDGDDIDGEDTNDDTDSATESDGVSSDDSSEIDVGVAQFLLTGTAYDVCYNALGGVSSRTEIGKNLVYIKADNAIQIVFNNFECSLELDPFIGYDEEKVGAAHDGIVSMGFVMPIIVGLVAAFL